MLEVSQIKSGRAELIKRLKVRNYDGESQIQEVLDLDEQRKSTQGELDELLAQQNASSKKIGELFKTGRVEEANKLKEDAPALKEQVKELGNSLSKTEEQIKVILLDI
ncbi:MAG: serine--tRNA ligase, partial [Flavobacteriales bacterium]|nr:serine--tRNA ligase [Flavobacteriales bacterium]